MGLFDKLKTVLNDVTSPEAGKVAEIYEAPTKPKRKTKPKEESVEPTVKKPRASKKKAITEDPEKTRANKRGEPWVKILSMDLDPANPGNGAFELDWNDKFVANLVRAGFQGRTDQDVVDNWFQTVCRNIALETYEQFQADPSNRSNNRRDLGNGRTEVS